MRLEAEIVRDAALAASGLLSDKIGGPSVYPPQPEGIFVVTQQKKAWPESQGADRYRRGMYIYFWRSSPYPMLPTFDAPEGNTTCTRRARSNTPLQALTLANDRVFVEIAEALAARILREAGKRSPRRDSAERFWSASREPSRGEAGWPRLSPPSDRLDRTNIGGEFLGRLPKPGALAIDEDYAGELRGPPRRVLLNLDEFITRE